jgi:NAD(P)-dependent dehydrogenase (short-subunit alcohol dehydrogenase family)
MAKDETPMFMNKVAVITGAGSGIGRATSLQLAAQGARLALSDINLANVEETATLATAAGAPEVYTYELDVADKDATFATAATVKERFGTVNFVMNNAGVAVSKNVLEMPLSDFEWLMGINFWGVVYGTYAYLPTLIESGDGHLVNISSLFGLLAVPTQSAYNAAKFGVRGFTEALRQEMLMAGNGVGVSCVHPGGIATNIARDARTDKATPQELDEQFKKVAKTSPAKAAATILKGVEKKRARILIGPDAEALDLMTRVLGSRYQAIVWRATKRLNPIV